jgi:DNA-binding NtrC family response regulator
MAVICVGVEIPSRIGDVEVVNVITGSEALAKLAHRPWEAVAIGPRVPDMAVSAIVDAIVSRYPRVPVVLVADAPRDGIWEHAPFADERLHAALVRACEVGRLRQAVSGGEAGELPDEDLEQTFQRGSIRDMERLMIFDRLDRLNQNRTRSAASLAISVRTLRNKLREYREATAPVATHEEG